MNAPGASLTELLLTLTIISIMATLAVPQARHGLDALYVRSAREAVFGVATQARALAIARGGADLVIDADALTASAVDAAGVEAARAQLGSYRVEIAADGARRIVLHYDARGIGRMTSRTVQLRRGAALAGLTFSSYGRVRRW